MSFWKHWPAIKPKTLQTGQVIISFGWWGAILLSLGGLLVLGWPYAASAYYLNHAGQSLTGQDRQGAIVDLGKALRFEPDNPLAYRQLAATYLDQDQPEQALVAARQAVDLAPDDPLAHLTLGDVYDRLGDHQQAIAHYEAGRVGDRRPQLTVNYLQLADRLWAGGDQEAAVTIWRDKVRGTGYGDLYANWRLARYYADDTETAAPYKKAALYFPLESVAPPPDPRLTTYQAQAIVGVVADGLWPRETLLNVVSYRVWQDQSPTAEDFMRVLVAVNPDDADMQFYLGELYQRRGDLTQAETAYQEVLSIDSTYAQAHLRLGMVAEERQSLQEALTWYEQYYKMAPDDLLGLKKLTEINEVLDTFEAKELHAKLGKRTDARYVAAKLLGVTPAQVKVGPNLVENGELEWWQNGVPEGWRLGTYLGSNEDNGIYIAGQDMLSSDEKAARITGLRGGQMPDGTVTFSEYVGQDIEVSDATYLISVYYRTWSFTNNQKGFLFLGDYARSNSLRLIQTPLSDSTGQLTVAHFLAEGPSITMQITPLVRILGSGNLIIQAFTVSPINYEQ